MADTQLEILIRTIADLDGIKLTKQQTDELTTSLKEQGVKYEDLTDKTTAAGKSSEGLNMHGSGTRILFSELNRIAPGAGLAMHSAFLGPIGPAILLTGVIAGVFGLLEKYSEELDKAGEAAGKPLSDGVRQLREAWEETIQKVSDYYAALEMVSEHKDAIGKRIEDEKKLTEARLDGIEKEIEALGRQRVAYLKSHGATPEAIAAAEKDSKSAAETIAIAKGQETVSSLQSELTARTAPGRQANINDEAKRTAAAAAAAAAEVKSLKEERDKLTPTSDKKTDNQQRLERAEAYYQAADDMLHGRASFSQVGMVAEYTSAHLLSGPSEAGRSLNTETVTARAAVEMDKKRVKQIEAQLEEKEQAAKVAEEKAKNAATEGEHNAQRVSDLPDIIKQAQSVQNVKSGSIGTTSAIDSGVISQIASADRSGVATEALAALERHLMEQDSRWKSILKIINDDAKRKMSDDQILSDIQSRMATLDARNP